VLARMGRAVRRPRLLRVRLSVGGPVLQLLREVSHGSLPIRCLRGPDTGTYVDLAFSGVEYVACPWLMRGAWNLRRQVQRTCGGCVERAWVHEAPGKVFVLL
jgi:hypothetical protein